MVLSLFSGTGTDLIAAMTLGRPAIGVDINTDSVGLHSLIKMHDAGSQMQDHAFTQPINDPMSMYLRLMQRSCHLFDNFKMC